MEKETRYRVRPNLAIIMMVVGLIPLMVGALLLLTSARDTYRQIVGEHLSEMADHTQLALRDHLNQWLRELASMTTVPVVRQAVQSSNQRLLDPQELLDVLVEWDELDPSDSPILKEIFENPAAQFLQDYMSVSIDFKEIILADEQGRLVAASNKTSDYHQQDEAWWKQAYYEGEGGTYTGDIYFDESASVYAIELAQPVMDRQGKAIGVMKVVIAADQIFAFINSVEVGRTGQAVLVGRDGLVLITGRGFEEEQRTYPYYADVLRSIDRRRSFVDIEREDTRLLLGFPSFNFNNAFPNLNWQLIVEQPYVEALGPFGDINRQFLYVLLSTVLIVGVLFLIYTWMLDKPVVESDPHLGEL